jgi:hypothetical protein
VNTPEDALAGILAEHWWGDLDDADGWRCACGTAMEPTDEAHHAHLAQVLAEYAAEREAQALATGIAQAVTVVRIESIKYDQPNQWVARDLLQSVARKVDALDPYRKDQEADHG